MFFTSSPIHRPKDSGSQRSSQGLSDLQRLSLGQVPFDPNDRAAEVENQSVGGEPHRLVLDIAGGVDKEEVMWLARDPQAAMPVDGHLLERRARSDELAEEL